MNGTPSRRTNYFCQEPGAPPPLNATVRRAVRFEEVDLLQIAWHGHYISYFEDARVALGERLGIGYMDFYRAGLITPLVQVHVDYFLPLTFRQEITIEARLHWSDAVRLNMSYTVHDADERICAAGCTVQLVQDANRQVVLIAPPFIEEFRRRWRAGEIS